MRSKWACSLVLRQGTVSACFSAPALIDYYYFPLHTTVNPMLCLPSCAVQGEAIAFALGGNKRMLRAKSLASLINQAARRNDGAARAQVRGPWWGMQVPACGSQST